MLEPRNLNIIFNIFAAKGWDTEEPVKCGRNLVRKRFDLVCSMLELLTPIEQKLIVTLLQDFQVITPEECVVRLKKVLLDIPAARFEDYSCCYVLPLKEKNVKLVKSGHLFVYPAARNWLPIHPGTVNFSEIKPIDSINDAPADQNRRLFVVLDDYIGSGESASGVIGDFEAIARSDDDLIFASVAAMHEGKQEIERQSFNLYTSVDLPKGISQSSRFASDSERSNAIGTMLEIERRIEVQAEYSLGYNKSEALISLTRTPDNTFPVYWWPTVYKNMPWPSPFWRDL